jgi:hypothetical protein
MDKLTVGCFGPLGVEHLLISFDGLQLHQLYLFESFVVLAQGIHLRLFLLLLLPLLQVLEQGQQQVNEDQQQGRPSDNDDQGRRAALALDLFFRLLT